jgi:hypothetical protein
VIARALSFCIPPYVYVVLVASQSNTVCRTMTDACQAVVGIRNDICYPSGIIWSHPVLLSFCDMAWGPTARQSDLKLFADGLSMSDELDLWALPSD